jgi:Ion channel
MITQFAVSTAMLIVCVFIHGAGLFSLSRALRSEAAAERLRHIDPLSLRGALFTLSIVLALFILHGVEIWLFALLYLGLDAIGSLEDALYFSTISYSTVGYSDTHITGQWRLLGPFESILGMVLLGWSTAFFFRMLGRIDPH